MKALQVRKNFLFDRTLVDEAQKILKKRHKNLTQAITLYLKAVVKNPEILDEIEKSANKRDGSFIGMLDGMIGNESYKEMRNEFYKESSRFE
ncbi:hypothetical protein [Nitratifractor sp.]|uniref:hypothetical protein n=1 Tax=Nitratifractor sp. TaxID=2268144 RepID=UPI0025E8AA57|nr:hypothetical protein [Nitratifractor sp.]